MLLVYDNKIIEKPLYSFNEKGNLELTKNLREKNYATQDKVLKNWDLVRTFLINNYKLTSGYIHFIEQEI